MKRWDAKFFGLIATSLAGSILLAQTPQQKAWSILEEGANEKSPDKRSKEVRALGLVPHSPKAAQIAEKALEDERPEVRAAAATALGLMPSRASIPNGGFGYAAFKELRKDDVSPVRAAAAKVLAKDPDLTSARALVQAASDKSWTVRAAALDAIAERGDPSLLEDIVPAMSDHKDLVRYTAAAAVIKLSTIHEPATTKGKSSRE